MDRSRLRIYIWPNPVRGAIYLPRHAHTDRKGEKRETESNKKVFHTPTLSLHSRKENHPLKLFA
jgi:hypothetical protein